MHDEMLAKLLKKKKSDKVMSEPEKQAKMEVLKNLDEDMAKAMSEKLAGLKKVTVASDSSEGLEQGLEKAKEMLEAKEMEDEEPSEEDDMELSEIEAKIKELEELKKQKMMK